MVWEKVNVHQAPKPTPDQDYGDDDGQDVEVGIPVFDESKYFSHGFLLGWAEVTGRRGRRF